MKAMLYTILVVSGLVMILAMTKLIDGPKFSNIPEYKNAWRTFRSSRSGKIWAIAYLIFLLAFVILSLNKYMIISLEG